MAVKDIVEKAITDHKVTIFSKSWCPHSNQAKATLKELVDTADIHILELDEREDGEEIQNYLQQRSGQRTVPNIFIHTKHVGGNDAVQAVRSSGELQKLLAA